MHAARGPNANAEPWNGRVSAGPFIAAEALAAQLAAASQARSRSRRHAIVARAASFLPALAVTTLIIVFSTDTFNACDSFSAVTAAIAGSPGAGSDGAWWIIYKLLRKAAHAAAFFVLGLCCFPFESHGRQRWLPSLVLCGTLAIGTELMQVYSFTRQGRVLDVVIDVFFFIPGVLVLPFCTRPLRRLRRAVAGAAAGYHPLHHLAAAHPVKRDAGNALPPL